MGSAVADGAGTGDLSGFAEQLLAVIDEGRRTATYKLAVLLAIMDSCAESVTARGVAPRALPTRMIARHVARLYWPQLRPFPAPTGLVELRQITNKSATVITALRSAFASMPAVNSWEVAETVLSAHKVEQVLDDVEGTVARYPLLLLQTIDGVPRPFIYDVSWNESVGKARLRAGTAIELRPGAGDQLIRLAPLVRPLVELHWVRMVAALNRLDLMEEDLHGHLFGTERVPFPRGLRRDLAELQDGRCFYCRLPLETKTEIDHFIPWSRWPNDAVENLVVAHPSCNNHKSDRLPGLVPLRFWCDRLRHHGEDLAVTAEGLGWRSDRQRTTSLARSVYAHLPIGSPVWDGPGSIAAADADELLGMLATL